MPIDWFHSFLPLILSLDLEALEFKLELLSLGSIRRDNLDRKIHTIKKVKISLPVTANIKVKSILTKFMKFFL